MKCVLAGDCLRGMYDSPNGFATAVSPKGLLATSDTAAPNGFAAGDAAAGSGVRVPIDQDR